MSLTARGSGRCSSTRGPARRVSTCPTRRKPLPAHLNPANCSQTQHYPDFNIHLELTYNPLDPTKSLAQVRSPDAGANVRFLGTTQSTFNDRLVARLTYSEVAVTEESIAIAVSAGHRGAAWKAGEEALEQCMEKAEIWKREEFVEAGEGEGEWRANRDTDPRGNLAGQ
ncbi:hypothetical protein AJ78_06343 [Emergomyces pasteurianus Ep9510]|uniref:Common component for nitrate reductase and xanthine dehydrogenase protein H n=1 Tax=Emergomyces pasteurianus Ep9510 TaxID=1447872 RepID=A0A1J9QDC7_9EURO|nr:hypothetical protein AJ78_06343 [Emergomyces pasteurianus Ep9510]